MFSRSRSNRHAVCQRTGFVERQHFESLDVRKDWPLAGGAPASPASSVPSRLSCSPMRARNTAAAYDSTIGAARSPSPLHRTGVRSASFGSNGRSRPTPDDLAHYMQALQFQLAQDRGAWMHGSHGNAENMWDAALAAAIARSMAESQSHQLPRTSFATNEGQAAHAVFQAFGQPQIPLNAGAELSEPHRQAGFRESMLAGSGSPPMKLRSPSAPLASASRRAASSPGLRGHSRTASGAAPKRKATRPCGTEWQPPVVQPRARCAMSSSRGSVSESLLAPGSQSQRGETDGSNAVHQRRLSIQQKGEAVSDTSEKYVGCPNAWMPHWSTTSPPELPLVSSRECDSNGPTAGGAQGVAKSVQFDECSIDSGPSSSSQVRSLQWSPYVPGSIIARLSAGLDELIDEWGSPSPATRDAQPATRHASSLSRSRQEIQQSPERARERVSRAEDARRDPPRGVALEKSGDGLQAWSELSQILGDRTTEVNWHAHQEDSVDAVRQQASPGKRSERAPTLNGPSRRPTPFADANFVIAQAGGCVGERENGRVVSQGSDEAKWSPPNAGRMSEGQETRRLGLLMREQRRLKKNVEDLLVARGHPWSTSQEHLRRAASPSGESSAESSGRDGSRGRRNTSRRRGGGAGPIGPIACAASTRGRVPGI